MTSQDADELARLHRLISVHEFPQALPAAILTGEVCLWCLTLIDGTAVELGPSADFPLAGCEPCYSARLAWYVSWYDWHDHYQSCVACRQRRTCYVGHGRRILHEQTTGPADKPQPTCFPCRNPLLPVEMAAPLLWHSPSTFAPRFGYAHVRCLTERATVR
ncbi:hypothetical protein [Streptomyces sp. NPDC051132]|uniref:hypothetical protein n=1 Tax=unclassified Streptomyces TaxID=2593676 RepID=UPI0034174D3D